MDISAAAAVSPAPPVALAVQLSLVTMAGMSVTARRGIAGAGVLTTSV